MINEMLTISSSDRVCKMQWAWVFGLNETVEIMSIDVLIPRRHWFDLYKTKCLKTKSRKERGILK